MKMTTATNIKNHFGQYLEASISEPIIIEKTGRSVAVMLSMQEYERLTLLEDQYWAQKASLAEKEGYIGKQASLKLLKVK